MNIIKAFIIIISMCCMQYICADKKTDAINAFTEAAYKGDLKTLQNMLDQKLVAIDDQAPKYYKRTALIAALSLPENTLFKTDTIKNKLEVAKYLLSLGANIHIGGRSDSVFDKYLSDKDREIKKRSAFLEAAKAQEHLIWYDLGKPENKKMPVQDYHDQMDLYREIKQLIEQADISEDKLLKFALELDVLHEISLQ